jgi:HK97 family phage major capsid protein
MLAPGNATIHNVRSGEQWSFPRLTAHASTGGTVTAEAAPLAELDATISAVAIKPVKYGYIQLWSSELDTDNVLGLESALAQSAGIQLALDTNNHLTNGTGTTEPIGFLYNAATSTATSGTAGGNLAGDTFFGYNDLVDLYMSVPPSVRARGKWQVATSAFSKILKMRDSNGYPYVQQDVTNDAVMTLLGRPLVENADMAAVGSASTSVAFAAWDNYHIVRLPVRIEASRDYKFSTDQVALRVIERVDGRLVGSGINVLTSDDT